MIILNRTKISRLNENIKAFVINNYLIFIFSIIYFLMLLTFLNSGHFIDENDNFLGAIMVVKGRDIYSLYHSQHMPLAYYIFALPALLFNINTVTGFRLSFYILMVLIWIIMFFRYKNKFGKTIVLIYPIFYIFSMAFFEIDGCSAISDQFQAQGLAIIFLEFLYFLKTKEINWKTSTFVSLGILLSFGTTFVSSLAIFVIAMAVLYIEIKFIVKEKMSITKWSAYVLRKYWHLLAIVAFPFLVLILWYLLTGNLKNFYLGAYWLNRNIYAKYGAPGQNILEDALSTINWYYNTFNESLVNVFVNGFVSLKFIFLIAINITFFIILLKKYKEIAFFVAAFTLMCGIRGFDDFHSMAYYAITFIMGCIIFKNYFLAIPVKRSLCAYILVCFAIASFSFQFACNLPQISHLNESFKNTEYQKGSTEYLIRKLITSEESLYVSTLDIEMYLRAQRYPNYGISTSVPWMWEVYRETDFYYLDTYKPKVLWHSDEHEVWGYKIRDYAPDFIEYVHENYTLLSEKYPGLFVRNEFLSDAQKILEEVQNS